MDLSALLICDKRKFLYVYIPIDTDEVNIGHHLIGNSGCHYR
jgi:hypothetical protein